MAFIPGSAPQIYRLTGRRFTTTYPSICKRPRTTIASMRIGGSLTEKLIAASVARGVEKNIATQVVASAEQAVRDWTGNISDFLTPPESAAMAQTLSALPDATVHSWGGYEDAERTVVLSAHSDIADSPEALLALLGDQLTLLKIEGDFTTEKASHRDFMGAVLNAGISRSKIGDIIVLDTRGAEVVVASDVADFLRGAITSVRNAAVRVERAPLHEIEIPPKRVKELQSVEASMRLDAVVSAGFNISRSKLAAMSRSGLVFVNYKEVKAPAKNLKTGDIVSVRGVGKLVIGECSTTAKGRYRIEMKRYI